MRIKRYLLFLIQYFLLEKPRGLDFTMRNLNPYRTSSGIYHGYSKTNEKHLRDIFGRLSYKDARLLDVGCGKGVVLKEAVRFSFQKIAGIEIDRDLVKTAEKNMIILKIADRVECIHADAAEFTGYGTYNVFFFFNPFSEKILRQVVSRIIDSRNEMDEIVVIYHNPRFISVFEENFRIMEKEMMHDNLKDYNTCIFKCVKI